MDCVKNGENTNNTGDNLSQVSLHNISEEE